MTPDVIAEYDRSRNLTDKPVRSVCYAPHVNLFFDMFGNVRACCWNKEFPVGDARVQTLDEIWSGTEAKILRRAVEAYDFSKGCKFCDMQTADGWTERAVMKAFDRYRVGAPDPQWPRRMEFSISNACNLECVMCNGNFSSAIRSHREKLPPTTKYYSSEFLESVHKYLPHLEQCKFLGGEPFLITEYYRIWEMMVETAPHVACHITTNGTQYNHRVAKFMEKLKFSFAVSLDGATKKTVESIRVNANFEEQMDILKTLRDYTRERRTDLSLTYCMMRQNWHEFGEFCLMADSWDCNVGINTVTYPPQFAINTLPLADLRPIVDTMERQAAELEGRLKRNRGVWLAEFQRLQRKARSMQAALAPA